MGLLVSVYKNQALGDCDCTCNGVSNRFTTLCVTNIEGPFEPSEKHPAVVLETGPFNSLRLVPVEVIEGKKHSMMGGNYAGTSDSRFNEACCHRNGSRPGVVAIHDRVEG